MDVGHWLFIVIIGLILLFSIVSNILVILSVIKFKKLRTITNVMICNLAVSDILLSAFYMPQKLHDISHSDNYYEGEALCRIINFFPIFVITNSCYTLVCVSFERRRAIIESHKPQMTFSKLAKVIPIVWCCSFIVSFPTFLEYTVIVLTQASVQTNSFNVTVTSEEMLTCGNDLQPRLFVLINATFVEVVSFVVPQLLILVNYVKLAWFVHKRTRQIQSDNTLYPTTSSSGLPNNAVVPHVASSSYLSKNRIRLVKMMILVAAMFAISWFPFYVLYAYTKITKTDGNTDSTSFVTLALISLAAFSTAYNVVVYVMFNDNFKQAIRRLLQCSIQNWDASRDR